MNNILYINKSSEEDILIEGNIKTLSEEGYQSSRTNKISLVKTKINKKEMKRIVVRILGIGQPPLQIPLFILFRALGIESDKRILSYIIKEDDSEEVKSKLYDLIIPCAKDSQPIYNQKDAIQFLSYNTKEKIY